MPGQRRSTEAGVTGGRRSSLPRPTRNALRLGLLALGLLGAAVNTGNNLIYLLFSLLVAAVPVSIAMSHLNLRRIGVGLRLPVAPRVGSPFTIDVEITSDRPRIAARSLVLSVLTDQGELGPAYIERLERGVTALTLLSRGKRRGKLKILGVQIRSTFPFGLVRRFKTFERGDQVLVLPASSPAARVMRKATHLPGASALASGVLGTEYFGLRQGGLEDDVRKVDWKVTARRGVLMIRETAGEGRGEIALNVRTRMEGHPEEARRRFEEHVSAVAGSAQHVLLEGGIVRLSVDGGSMTDFAGRGGLTRVLRCLATLTPTDENGSELPPSPLPPEPGRGASKTPDPRSTAPGRALRGSTVAALAISVVTLFACEGIGFVAFGALALALIATTVSPRLVTRKGSVMDRLWVAAAVLALAVFFLDIFGVRHNLLLSSTSLLVFITLFALFSARESVDDGRILLLSFLQLVLASALTTEVGLALPLLGWLLVASHGMIGATALPTRPEAPRWPVLLDTDAGRIRYAAPALRAAAATIVAGIAVFLVVPHFGTGTFRPGAFQQQRVTGFSDTARLGDIGLIKQDNSKVMEIELSGASVPVGDLKWRGVALDRFDGKTWTRTYSDRRRLAADDRGRFFPIGNRGATDGPFEIRQDVRLEPVESTVVFAANRPRRLTSTDFRFLGQDAFGNLEFRMRPGRRLSYTVTSVPPPRDPEVLRRASGEDPEAVRSIHLRLPPLDPRVGELAERITAGASTRFDAVVAIETWLSSNLQYSLDVKDRGLEDPLRNFLFEGMSGHCEYFATGMIVLARKVGIPARFVTGYLRGEQSNYGRRFVVRQSNAHSWVEVHFPGVGWVSFDPTPAVGRAVGEPRGFEDMASYLYSSIAQVWDDYLIGIDLDDQARGFLVIAGTVSDWSAQLAGLAGSLFSRGLVVWAVAGAVLFVLGFAVRRGWARRGRRVRRIADEPVARALPAFYRQVLDLLADRGLLRHAGETPVEFTQRAGRVLGRRGTARMSELTQLYYRVRFDPLTSEREASKIARALVGDIKEALAPATLSRRP